MQYIILATPIIVALAALAFAMKQGFNKQAFFVAAGITMIINMFTIHHVTLFGFLCTLIIPLAAIYIGICLFLSIRERRE